MNLITTANKRTWGENNSVVFLGEWCRIYKEKNAWSKLEHKVLPYHWDNRERCYSDYKYLTTVYEEYLQSLSSKLNHIHNCNYSYRYWRIVLGPWLRSFIDVVFDRYTSIVEATEFPEISSTLIMDYKEEDWAPKDYYQFYKNITTDKWNHIIYSEIIKNLDTINYKLVDKKFFPPSTFNKKANGSIPLQLRNYIFNNIIRLVPIRSDAIYFTSSYFSLNNLINLQLKLKQIPYPHGPVIEIKDIPSNQILRTDLKFSYNNDYEKILGKMIPKHLPKCYLEGFNQLNVLSEKYFPKKVRIIFTGNADSQDDAFKVWAAGQIEKGTKLYIGQHGGPIGVCLWSQRDDHQINISDKFFSWGWTGQNSKVEAMPATKLINLNKNIYPKKNGEIISVLTSLPRYFYCSFNMPIAGQFLNYINYQIQLLKLLDPKLQNLFSLRLDHPDFNWNLIERFSDSGFANNIDYKNINLYQRLKQCRLCIAPHNATVFLETFSANFPTVLYWNPKYYEIKKSAKKHYDKLNEVGILHYTPQSAASLLNEIYHDPMKWWMQEDIQLAKDKFCKKNAYVSDNWLDEWENELLSNE